MQNFNKISASFFDREPALVAQELVGKILVKELKSGVSLGGRIIETEAYLAVGDESSHSFKGKTKRNLAMFAKAGTIYVYKSYGIHHCINITTEAEGIGSAVLIRALFPLFGIDAMKQNRRIDDERRISNGPGNLTQALGITIDDNFQNIETSTISILNDGYKHNIAITKRIGISKSKDLMLRFVENKMNI